MQETVQDSPIAEFNPAEYVSTAEAARMLGVHQTTIITWVTSGRLSGVRIGPRLHRVRKDALSQLITRFQTGASDAA